MSQNLELKHFCDNFPSIRKALRNLGAEKDVVKSQTDYYFNLSPEKMKQHGRLKVRVEKSRMYAVYYERPSFEQDSQTVSKYHILEVDAQTLAFLKKSLGVRAVVKKKREVWRKDHTVFYLDQVEGVGGIFEVELQKPGRLSQADRKLFASYQEQLVPLLGAVISGSNVDLVEGT